MCGAQYRALMMIIQSHRTLSMIYMIFSNFQCCISCAFEKSQVCLPRCFSNLYTSSFIHKIFYLLVSTPFYVLCSMIISYIKWSFALPKILPSFLVFKSRGPSLAHAITTTSYAGKDAFMQVIAQQKTASRPKINSSMAFHCSVC